LLVMQQIGNLDILTYTQTQHEYEQRRKTQSITAHH
jgi:hypothetical protein